VCSRGLTFDSVFENGSWSSRHAEPEPDRRRQDRHAAHEDRGRDDDQVERDPAEVITLSMMA
jgi:hypothetical protein